MSDGEGGNRVAERPPDPKGENSENRTTEEVHQVDDEEESEEEDDQDVSEMHVNQCSLYCLVNESDM